MGTLTIRNLDDNVKQKLRKRAAARGVSMEQEALDLLTHEAFGTEQRGSKITLEEIMKFSQKHEMPFDQKQAQDEFWDYLYEDDHPKC